MRTLSAAVCFSAILFSLVAVRISGAHVDRWEEIVLVAAGSFCFGVVASW